MFCRIPTRLFCLHKVSLSTTSRLTFQSMPNSRTIVQQSQASEVISETAKSEGGPAKGSMSAQTQSQADRKQNLEHAVQEVGGKMQAAPETLTSEDAAYLKSREARATGQGQPPSDSISADAQRLASANERTTAHTTSNTSKGRTDAIEQSAQDRLQNFEETAEDMVQTMSQNPERLSKDQANAMHSREQRAFGTTSKGGVASQAQSLASENEAKSD